MMRKTKPEKKNAKGKKKNYLADEKVLKIDLMQNNRRPAKTKRPAIM